MKSAGKQKYIAFVLKYSSPELAMTCLKDYLPITIKILPLSFSAFSVDLQFSATTSVGFLDMGLSGRICTERQRTHNVRGVKGTNWSIIVWC